MPAVQLYVYDLSNGMARQMSRQLTGKQIDGIWHTSVVVFGKEVFYGQGICMTKPGRSHHGQPLKMHEMGETMLDEETFMEYLNEMRDHYRADKYHLLDFNCNSFTDDVVGFLTGKSIPSYIKDLPTDFLSTPFGQALRPTIDSMFRRPAPGLPPSGTTPQYPPAPESTSITTDPASLTSPLHILTNPTSFTHFVSTHRASIALFTSQTCPPCRIIEPVYSQLADEFSLKAKAKGGAAFAKIDMDTGRGGEVASAWNVRATPTFLFFLDGKKVGEVKGANQGALRQEVEFLIFQAYPPHPHRKLKLSAIDALSMNAITFTQVPPFDTVLSKLVGSIQECDLASLTAERKEECRDVLQKHVGVYLKARFASTNAGSVKASKEMLDSWARVTKVMVEALPIEALFPLVDLWRVGILEPSVAEYVRLQRTPVDIFISKATRNESTSKGARNFLLTTLRLLCNAIAQGAVDVAGVTGLLVTSLLHEDVGVRVAAGSCAFDVAASVQRRRVAQDSDDEEGDWDIEIVSAIVEALERESESEEVVHRLTAALAFLTRYSPRWEGELKSLVDVLGVPDVLKNKLEIVHKKEIKKLVEQVSMLCTS